MEQKQPEREFDTIRELAAKTGKTYRTIHRHIQARRIRAVRLGGSVMIPRREVDRILTRGF